MTVGGYSRNVFINCPFDPGYRPLFEAIVFVTYYCGFRPRCALEVDDSSQVRIEKITGIIRDSRLAVHDISRTQLDRTIRLPRFNMPLELGMFLGAKLFGSGAQRRKAAIVLDEDRYRYQKFISDIAGQDIRAHGRSVDEAIHQVRNFLSTHNDADVLLPGGSRVAKQYRRFRRDLPALCRKLHHYSLELTFHGLALLIRAWLTEELLESDGAGA